MFLCLLWLIMCVGGQVIGEGLDPRATPVMHIMTPNPMVTRDTTSATDALQTMVTRGFRHLVSASSPLGPPSSSTH